MRQFTISSTYVPYPYSARSVLCSFCIHTVPCLFCFSFVPCPVILYPFFTIGSINNSLQFAVWNSSSSSSDGDPAPPEIHNAVQQNVRHYCNFPIRTSGTEGFLSFEKQLNRERFHLEMVQALLRHGDRTSSVYIPNMDNKEYDYNCTLRTSDQDHKQMFEEYAMVTRHFTLRDLLKGMKTSGRLLPSGQRCRVSQLTQKGFLQHFTLGKHTRTAYSSLINTGINSGNLHVRSTSRTRCIQSAAAFLYGLLTKDTIIKGEIAQWPSVGYSLHMDKLLSSLLHARIELSPHFAGGI